MKSLNDLKNDLDLVNSINWDILPEEAVGLHLEWGAGWAAHNYRVSGSKDTTYHFVISTWENPPIIYLYKRKSFDTEQIAMVQIPNSLKKEFFDSVGNRKGNYSIEGGIKKWLKKELIEN